MQNLPRFFGDHNDKVDSPAHLEALGDYLRAYLLHVTQFPEDIEGYECSGSQELLENCYSIFEKFRYSLQGEAKTWFHSLDER